MLRIMGTVGIAALTCGPAMAQETAEKPNILVIFGDDIGQTNLSAYSFGLMGYATPNIDRIAAEGMMFTDYYAEQSCTAGRSTFITGQSTLRTGLSKVGIPGATVGLQAADATMASALKDQGYATGQFGKNHLGDRDEFLPTAHGFDEFFGNLYHLNAEEEPEQRTYPRDPKFVETFGPRGVVRSSRGGAIEDTGPLTKKRMETIDDETSAAAIAFIERQAAADTPFFVWMNTTRMHFRTHVREEHRSPPGLTSLTEYADGMVEHDAVVGTILDSFIYLNDDGDIVGMRYENWKIVFEEQRVPGTMQVWAEPFVKLRLPKLFDLRSDPYERADITSNTYYDWLISQPYLILVGQTGVMQFLDTFKEFPPAQRPQSFSIDQIVEDMEASFSSITAVQ